VGSLGFGLGFFQRGPVTVSLQSPLQHEFRFALLGGNQANGFLVQPLGDLVFFDGCNEAPLVILTGEVLYGLGCAHCVLPEVRVMDTTLPSRLLAACCRRNGLIRSDNRICSKVRRRARLMTWELLRTVQEGSNAKHPGVE